MRLEVESARLRLQTILRELDQCCADGETFSPQLVSEAHALVRLLHEEGYKMGTVRQRNGVVIEIEPMRAENVAA